MGGVTKKREKELGGSGNEQISLFAKNSETKGGKDDNRVCVCVCVCVCARISED